MKIKPCPFCGSQPDFNDPDFCHPVTRPTKKGNQIFRAGCTDSNCGAEVLGDNAGDAVNNWNKRVKNNEH